MERGRRKNGMFYTPRVIHHYRTFTLCVCACVLCMLHDVKANLLARSLRSFLSVQTTFHHDVIPDSSFTQGPARRDREINVGVK